MTQIIDDGAQKQFFHEERSKRSYIAHAVGKRTFKHVMRHLPLFFPTFKALDIMDYAASLAPTDSRVDRVLINNVNWKAHLVVPKGTSDNSILIYFHGGAFLSCGLGTHKQFIERLSIETKNPVFAIDYRQYPDVFFSTSVEDCVEAVEWALGQGYAPEQISLAGDSAGGGLALKVAGVFRERNITLKSVVSLSGWLDFSTPYEDYKHWERKDAYIPAKRLGKIAELVLGHAPLPEHSPLAELKEGYPPLLLICGGSEILRVDTEQAYARCMEENLSCSLHYFSGGIHAFPVAIDIFPESVQALDIIKDFLEPVENLSAS